MPARRPLCRLGWADPTKIPVDKIAEEWRSQSSKGRYESAMWREAGLEEPGANLNAGAAAVVAEAEVDNLEAGGFFARFGREPTYWPPPNSHPSTHGRDAPGDAIDRGHMEIKNTVQSRVRICLIYKSLFLCA